MLLFLDCGCDARDSCNSHVWIRLLKDTSRRSTPELFDLYPIDWGEYGLYRRRQKEGEKGRISFQGECKLTSAIRDEGIDEGDSEGRRRQKCQ
jgi:hypothetical protein